MKIKIALVQHKAMGNHINKNLELGIEYCKRAKKKGADLILFPEMWSNGYVAPFQSEDCITDDYVPAFQKVAAELSIGVVITALTKGNKKTRNSAFVISQQGEILMQYDKVHTCDFGQEQSLESGNDFQICNFTYGDVTVKLGIMICYDREFPESARVLMLKGAELLLIPNACDMNPARINQISTRAFENMVGVAMANYPGERAGCSCGFSPIVFDEDGNYIDNTIFMAEAMTEDIFVIEFDLRKLRDYRARETWGNAYRKVKAYGDLLDIRVREPFERKDNQTGVRKNKHYVYLLRCSDDSIYTGWTTDLETRVKVHNRGKGAKYTKARLPVVLVYSEQFEEKSEALKREYEIKQYSRIKKLELIMKQI